MNKVSTNYWYDVVLCMSQAYIIISLINKNIYMAIEVGINNHIDYYVKLFEEKEWIEEKLDMKFEWLGKKIGCILTYKRIRL